MSNPTASSHQPNYGIDAPDVIRRFCIIGVIGIALGRVLAGLPTKGALAWGHFLAWPFLAIGCTFVLEAGAML